MAERKTNINKEEYLSNEIKSFDKLWQGGYYDSDPLSPLQTKGYNIIGYMSTLHVVYLTCIKPYINENSTILEIGPGRGAWTKALLKGKEIWCLDALSAEHNNFWEYIGKTKKVKYYQVSDFKCKVLPDKKFDYFFSFGVFCHISNEGFEEYMKNIYSKLKKNANGFIMIADYNKYNDTWNNIEKYSILNSVFGAIGGRFKKIKIVSKIIERVIQKVNNRYKDIMKFDENPEPVPGRWYHLGVDNACQILRKIGYVIVEKDVGAVLRDPIIHFKKK